ncbi:MAG TPA: hypothetical protein VI603_06580 [Saprospiraceae bacterium]|nr:hypothetical protein [Saprospiraceae bacterium]
MKKLRLLLLWGFFAFLMTGVVAQKEWRGAERTYALKVGTTKPIRDVLPRTPTDARKLTDWKASKPEYVRNFIGRRQVPVIREGTLPVGVDPLLNRVQTRDGNIAIVPTVNVEGIDRQQSESGVPDPNGDVSDQYYVQAVNSTWLQVFDLSGNEIGNPFLANTIWQQLGFSSAGDPILLFDQQAGRWFMTEFPSSNRVLIGVSDTGDPLGSWTAFAFSTPSFPDYPKYGIWPTAYVLTTNEGGSGIEFYTINRQDILNGEDTVDIQSFSLPFFPNPYWQTAQPVDWNGTMEVAEDTHPMIMRINDDAYGASPVDQVEVYEIIVDWENEANSVVAQTDVPVSPYDSEFCSVPGPGFSCVPQPNGVGIDGIPYIFMHACHYRNFATHSSIVGNFTVDASGEDDGGIRWIELRKTGEGEWELYQEGTVGSQDGLNRFMGGISIDGSGNIGLAYNVSSEDDFPSLRFTGRRANDPLGKMTVLEYEFAKGNGSVGGDRFGDYASMSVDNQDMFWYTGEYVRAGGQWASKIVGFKLLRKSIDIGPRELTSPVNSPNLGLEQVTACVINHGLLPQTTFDIGMITPDGSLIKETVVTDSLLTDSVYCHTFSAPVDFSVFGPHIVTIYTSMLLDSNVVNDTCRFTVIKLTTWDASIPRIDGLSQAICDTFTDLAFVLQNIGAEELTSAEIVWSVNGGPRDTISWSGNLASGAVEDIPIHIAGLNDAGNTILVYSQFPNGNMDQNSLNDTLEFMAFVTPGGQHTTLIFTTDNYPEESSWQVIDDQGNLVLQGGPYDLDQASFTEEWCLDTSQCYKFVILDSFGDGIEADGVAGDFQIVNGEGIVVAALVNPSFGLSDTINFCLQSNCALTANVFIHHENEPDGHNGSVSVFASNGVPPMQYSIDNGNSFQSSSFFNNLAPGVYTLLVRDAFGCFYVREFRILACDIQIMAEVTDATGAQNADGSVLLAVVGGNGAVEYSINGGISFQSDPLFLSLLPDTFNVVVRDSVDCEVTAEVIVDFSSGIKTTYFGHLIRVYPNPSAGYFHFEVEGLPATLELRYDVLSGDGKLVRSGIASNYSGIVKGAFSLVNRPSGDYYLRFRHPGLDRMIHVIKL